MYNHDRSGLNPTLRVRYSRDTLDDVTAGEKIGLGYSGGGSTDKADATATLEGTAGKRLSIQILKQTA